MSSTRFTSLAAALLIMAGMGTAYAQGPITAKIPFDFVAAGQTLPAGTYIFREALPNNNTNLAVTDGRGHGALVSATTQDYRDSGSKLVFRKRGDSYFLSDIFSPSGRLHFGKSKAESKLAETANSETVSVPTGD